MRRRMFPKLAATNLVKNRRVYVPYLLTCICTIGMYYIMQFLTNHEALDTMQGGPDIRLVLNLGVGVITIFAVIFLIYSNSFLMKRRKRELGLFNVLGMEKKHIGVILLWEQFYTIVLGFVGGLGLGILGSKLMLALLMRLLQFQVPFGFQVSGSGMRNTLIVFGLIFALMLFINIRQIHLVNPVELLSGSSTGEREPKAKWLMALAGIVSMGAGYYIAVTTESPLEAMLLFFVAVILVMLGTYLLFTAGSIAVLKFLRWKKGFYYKTNHFISVSGMIYRMKQNAVGLASICILSTGVLLMVSTTVCLYLGRQEITENMFPREVQANIWDTTWEQKEELVQELKDVAQEQGVQISDLYYYQSVSVACLKEGNNLWFARSEDGVTRAQKVCMISVLTEEEFNRLTGAHHHLADDQILVYTDNGDTQMDSMHLQGQDYQIQWLEDFPEKEYSIDVSEYYYLVMNSAQCTRIQQEQKEIYQDNAVDSNLVISAQPVLETDEEKIAFTQQVQERFRDYMAKPENENVMGYVQGKTTNDASFYATYGGLFFLGLFLGSLFLMGTALIIYYKQVSEGYEDQRRYDIMRKVGLSRREVKSSIRSQILMVFFLPLLMAVIHISFAFPLIRRLLAIFYLQNIQLFAVCTLCTVGVYGVVYGIIYLLTARTYYKIVG